MKIERVWSSESGHNVSIRAREGFKAKRAAKCNRRLRVKNLDNNKTAY
jgi:hypothetical protein